MGDQEFDKFAFKTRFHSVLFIGFPDGTTLWLAELSGSGDVTAFCDQS
jgi:hypothetical protein